MKSKANKGKEKVIHVFLQNEEDENIYYKLKALAVEERKALGEVVIEAMKCLLEKKGRI